MMLTFCDKEFGKALYNYYNNFYLAALFAKLADKTYIIKNVMLTYYFQVHCCN